MLELLYYNLTELEFRHRFLYTLLIRCIRAILESVFICHLAIPVIIYFISHIILIQIPQLRKCLDFRIYRIIAHLVDNHCDILTFVPIFVLRDIINHLLQQFTELLIILSKFLRDLAQRQNVLRKYKNGEKI